MTTIYEPEAGRGLDPRAVAAGCFESGSRAVLFDEATAPPEFFDLSTRVAGELLHELGKYGVRLAVVVPDVSAHSASFQDFAREADRGRPYRFFETREEAMAWLRSD